MKGRIRIFLLLALGATAACSKQPSTEPAPAAIRFEVTHTPAVTRSMITDGNELRNACTPDLGGQAIGLWAAMERGAETTNDVFQGVKLQWRPVGDKGHENNPNPDHSEDGDGNESFWNTVVTEGGTDRFAEVYWHPGETYYFRAYYPDGVQLANNTSATTFIAEYHTELRQEDMMAAYQKVVLTDKASLQQHVKLNMQHMLSAVKFTFSYKDEAGFFNSDRLLGVWLENTATGEFGDYALLVFGDGTEAGATHVDWYIMDTPAPGKKMYEWTCSAGLPFYRNDTENVEATAYMASSDPNDKGAIFTGSNNYVYMVPQELHPGTQLCFKTENSAGNVFRIDLPDHFTDAGGTVHNSLEPGYRYTFHVVISRLDVDFLITIREWNQLDSSYSIAF